MTQDHRITLNARQQKLLDYAPRDGFATVGDLAADHSTFNRPSLVRLGHLKRIDALVMDATAPSALANTADAQVFHAELRGEQRLNPVCSASGISSKFSDFARQMTRFRAG